MSKRKQLGGQIEGGATNAAGQSLVCHSTLGNFQGPTQLATTSEVVGKRVADARAMQMLADIFLTIFLELPAEEQAAYRASASSSETRVV
jgi:hypothetical protein